MVLRDGGEGPLGSFGEVMIRVFRLRQYDTGVYRRYGNRFRQGIIGFLQGVYIM